MRDKMRERSFTRDSSCWIGLFQFRPEWLASCSECLFDSGFQFYELRAIAGSAQAGNIRLRKMLIASVQIGGKRNVLNLPKPVHLHQCLRHVVEAAALPCACIDNGLANIPECEKDVHLRQVADKYKIATLLSIAVTA